MGRCTESLVRSGWDGLQRFPALAWLPDAPDISVRAESYFIAQTEDACWTCSELMRVYGFVLSAGHQTLGQSECDADAWYQHDEPAMVFYIADL